METTKVNDRLEFPMTLDMYPYTKEGLAAVEKRKPTEESSDGKGDEDKPAEPEVVHPPEYYKYVLRGIVVHTGSAQGGHYYSYIQEREPGIDGTEPRWFRFNDSVVTPFDPKEIPEECFGGVEERPTHLRFHNNKDEKPDMMEKYRNAYLLFYDRVLKEESTPTTSVQTPTSTPSTTTTPSTSSPAPTTTSITPSPSTQPSSQTQFKLFEQIWKQNQNLWHDRAVYDIKYYEFLWRLVSRVVDTLPPLLAPTITNAPDLSLLTLPTGADISDRFAVTQLAIKFVMMTLSRGRDKSMFLQWLTLLKKLLERDRTACAWLLHEFVSQTCSWGIDFLLNCPEPDIRLGISELISTSLTMISPLEMETLVPGARSLFIKPLASPRFTAEDGGQMTLPIIHDHPPCTSYVISFIDDMIHRYFNILPHYWKTFETYWRILYFITTLSPHHTLYIQREWNVLARCMDLYLEKYSHHPEINQFPIDSKGNRIVWNHPSDQPYYFRLIRALTLVTTPPRVLPYRPLTPTEEAQPLPPLSPYCCKDPIPINAITASLLVRPDTLDGFIVRFTREATTRRLGRELGDMFQHICWENLQVTQCIYTAGIEAYLKAWDYDHLRPFMRIFTALINIQDSLQTPRIEWLCLQFLTIIRDHMKYWKFTDFCIDHLIRLAKRQPLVYQYLQKHNDVLLSFIEWYQSCPECPTHRYSMHGHHHIMAHRPNSYQIRDPRINPYDVYGLPVKRKIQTLDMIRQGKPLDDDYATDSDYDFSERTFTVGDWVDCEDTSKKWLVARILQINNENGTVYIHFDGWPNKWDEWIHYTSPRIMPGGSRVSKADWENRGKIKVPTNDKGQRIRPTTPTN